MAKGALLYAIDCSALGVGVATDRATQSVLPRAYALNYAADLLGTYPGQKIETTAGCAHVAQARDLSNMHAAAFVQLACLSQ